LSETKTKIHLMNKQYNFAVQKCQRRFMCFSDGRNLLGIPDGEGGDQPHNRGLGRGKTGRNYLCKQRKGHLKRDGPFFLTHTIESELLGSRSGFNSRSSFFLHFFFSFFYFLCFFSFFNFFFLYSRLCVSSRCSRSCISSKNYSRKRHCYECGYDCGHDFFHFESPKLN